MNSKTPYSTKATDPFDARTRAGKRLRAEHLASFKEYSRDVELHLERTGFMNKDHKVKDQGKSASQIAQVDLIAEIEALNPNAEQAEAIAAFAHVMVKGLGGDAFIRELVAGMMTGGRVYLPDVKVPSSWALSQARRIAACISDT